MTTIRLGLQGGGALLLQGSVGGDSALELQGSQPDAPFVVFPPSQAVPVGSFCTLAPVNSINSLTPDNSINSVVVT